jgi:hypothetical protein
MLSILDYSCKVIHSPSVPLFTAARSSAVLVVVVVVVVVYEV